MIAIHPRVTILGGLDAAARASFADELTKALRGEQSGLEVNVNIDGRRLRLTADLARELGLDTEALAGVTLFPADLPGARAASGSATAPDDRNTDEVADAETALRDLTAALEDAQARGVGSWRQLEEAREAQRASQADAEAGRAVLSAEVERLQAQRAELELARVAIVGRMLEEPNPGDPGPVIEALTALRRLHEVKPKPPAAAGAAADSWTSSERALAGLPAPPQPPAWLVAPALAALREARATLAAAEAGEGPDAIDQKQVAALDRAHLDVLQAEQRAMRKGSRLNRRRLDGAHQAESEALAALGVGTYGEYLQQVAPSLEAVPTQDERIHAARAGLEDAEAVWEELHGGQPSPEWTRAKEDQAEARAEALEVIGHDVPDDQIAATLLQGVEDVVDTEWAESALADALRRAGADVGDRVDIEAFTDTWLEESPAHREARAAHEAEIAGLDTQIADVDEKVAEQKADDFFGDGPGAGSSSSSSGPLDALATAAEEAGLAEREAGAALAEARARLAEAQRSASRRDALAAAASATPPGRPVLNGEVDLSAVVGMEAQVYVVARLAALRGAPGGPLPLVLDSRVADRLPAPASKRLLGLLGRVAPTMQIVVLGDDGPIASWAKELGDQVAVRAWRG